MREYAVAPNSAGATGTLARASSDEATGPLREERNRLLALIRSSPTMNAAAASLGVTRSTLYRRLERCGLQPKRVFGGS
jgi:transcriptional regulator of acetoin/glycerol metabolism